MEPRSRTVSVPEYSSGHATAEETNLFRNFAAQIMSGEINESWPEIALKTQQVMSACFDSARRNGESLEV